MINARACCSCPTHETCQVPKLYYLGRRRVYGTLAFLRSHLNSGIKIARPPTRPETEKQPIHSLHRLHSARL
ncbi:hypothetical protein V2G26_015126 [Clonostachys chloroleuca]